MACLERIFLGDRSYPIKELSFYAKDYPITTWDINAPERLYLQSLGDGCGVFHDGDMLWDARFPRIDNLSHEEWANIYEERATEIQSQGFICLDDIFMATPTIFTPTVWIKK